jgi:rRNA maturation endonuclease Nob1
MIKALAGSQGPSVSDYLERLIATGRELKVGKEDWMECRICGARLKAKNISEHTSKVHLGGP